MITKSEFLSLLAQRFNWSNTSIPESEVLKRYILPTVPVNYVTQTNDRAGEAYLYEYDPSDPSGLTEAVIIEKGIDEFVDYTEVTTNDWTTINFSHLTPGFPCGEVTSVLFVPLQNTSDELTFLAKAYVPSGSPNDDLKSDLVTGASLVVDDADDYGVHKFPYSFEYYGKSLCVKMTGASIPYLACVCYKLHNLSFSGLVPDKLNAFFPKLGKGFYFENATFSLLHDNERNSNLNRYGYTLKKRGIFDSEVTLNTQRVPVSQGCVGKLDNQQMSTNATATTHTEGYYMAVEYENGGSYTTLDVPYRLTLSFK